MHISKHFSHLFKPFLKSSLHTANVNTGNGLGSKLMGHATSPHATLYKSVQVYGKTKNWLSMLHKPVRTELGVLRPVNQSAYIRAKHKTYYAMHSIHSTA